MLSPSLRGEFSSEHCVGNCRACHHFIYPTMGGATQQWAGPHTSDWIPHRQRQKKFEDDFIGGRRQDSGRDVCITLFNKGTVGG
ncbi:hypothetical protein GDO81_012413 [Engystomops pustulosus]|uniref:Uncharacterized protein n=1 Tax=Engystomops pustulosus TaxID=76066 RepID=A0AAV7BLQ3_ENGPU|nr:hypothetical protein GDO81_012413 [Engystomops pustulosus]